MTAVHFKGNIFSRFTRVVGAVRDWRGVDPSRADTSRGVNQRRRCGHEVNHRKTKEELRRALQQLTDLIDLSAKGSTSRGERRNEPDTTPDFDTIFTPSFGSLIWLDGSDYGRCLHFARGRLFHPFGLAYLRAGSTLRE